MIPSLCWQVLTFAAVVIPVVCIPGPSVLWIVAQRSTHGRRAVPATIAGDLSANLVQFCIASAGASAIVESGPALAHGLRFLGILWLVALARRRWVATQVLDRSTGVRASKPTFPAMFSSSLVTSGLNPKAIYFFVVVPPLFLVSSRPLLPQIAALATTFLVLDGFALWLYATASGRLADRAGAFGASSGRASAAVLIVAALMLLLAGR